MGIHHLAKVLKQHAPSAVTEIGVNKLDGKIIAIDTSQTIYQYVLAIRSSKGDLKDEKGNMTTHLQAIFYKSLVMTRLGCKLVYVFDGKPTSLKDGTLEKRKSKKEEIKFTITDEIVKQCKELLNLMGIPYVQALEEADPQCAYMAQKKIVDYVQSDDMDLLPFGTPFLIKTVRKSSKTVTKYSLEKILDKLDIDLDAFIDICILLGCDYCDTIKGLGEKRVVDHIQEHDDIESIIKAIKKKEIKGMEVSETFEKTYKSVRKYFKKPSIIKKSELKIKWKQPDALGILSYMEKKGFNRKIIGNKIQEYWNHWCDGHISDPKNKKELLKKDLFPGIKLEPEIEIVSDEE